MQITDHIHAIKIPFKIKLPTGVSFDRFVYAYLIYGDKIYLIDSGVASSEKIIFDYIRETGRTPEDIYLIVLTHSHPDHIGAAGAIKEKTGCRVAAHKAEKDWIEDIELQFKQRPVPDFQSLVKSSVSIDSLLNDGDVLSLTQGMELEVIHTPGHSKGSIALLFRKDKAMFSGDSIFIPGDLPVYENVSDSAESIKKLKGIAGIEYLLSSWDDPKKGNEVYRTMDKGLGYLQTIHERIAKIANGRLAIDPMELCEKVVSELKLPALAVNPLVAKSFQSNLKLLSKEQQ